MNAFMVFSREHRDDVKRSHPGATAAEIAVILGAMWRSLCQREKDKYKEDYHDYHGDSDSYSDYSDYSYSDSEYSEYSDYSSDSGYEGVSTDSDCS